MQSDTTDMQSLARVRSRASSSTSKKSPGRAAKSPAGDGPGHERRGATRAAGTARQGRFQAGPDGFLGTPTKSSAPSPAIDPETGEITGDSSAYSRAENRAQRFAIQSVVRLLLPDSRTAKCFRWRRHKGEVQVWKSIEHKTAHYKGLQVCGSVWACPVCAAKIAERRRGEISSAINSHEGLGGFMLLLTLTAPHSCDDNLVELLEQQAMALKFFNKDFTVCKVFKSMGCVGQIRALETTYGRKSEQNNGWHPHYHVLLFAGLDGVSVTPDEPQRKDWATRLYLRWAACCERAGLGIPSYAHGLKLDDGSKAAKYASKWGLEDEMTKGHIKRAWSGETPFDLLRSVLADPKDKQAGVLFVEYSHAFKGKRQLYWSPGLKARYEIGDVSDEDLANKIEDDAIFLGQLTLDQWRAVLRFDGRALVLQLAENGGWDAVLLYLDHLHVSSSCLAAQKEVCSTHPDLVPLVGLLA